jgi:hypothetical protein
LFIYVLLLPSCNNLKKPSNTNRIKDINQLIAEHKDSALFLSFWPGMDTITFKKVKEYESKNGNLTNGNFMLNFYIGEQYYDYTMSVNQSFDRNSIDLRLILEKPDSKIDYEWQNEINLRVLNYLNNFYDSKYAKLSSYSIKPYLRTQIDRCVWATNKKNIENLVKIDFSTYHPHQVQELDYLGRWVCNRPKVIYEIKLSYLTQNQYHIEEALRLKKENDELNKKEQEELNKIKSIEATKSKL